MNVLNCYQVQHCTWFQLGVFLAYSLAVQATTSRSRFLAGLIPPIGTKSQSTHKQADIRNMVYAFNSNTQTIQ